MSTLPSARALLWSMLPPISCVCPETLTSPPSNPLHLDQKPLFLTLHCLFPNELLPALDLLDRRLVTRLVLHDQGNDDCGDQQSDLPGIAEQARNQSTSELPTTNLQQREGRCSIHHVRSSNQKHSRFSKRDESTTAEEVHYEVRLQAWNCSCAAFAFAAFSGGWDASEAFENAKAFAFDAGDMDGRQRQGRNGWQFGGVTTCDDVPVCKHLLACVLAERVQGFLALVEERKVGRVDMALWAAGWGGGFDATNGLELSLC